MNPPIYKQFVLSNYNLRTPKKLQAAVRKRNDRREKKKIFLHQIKKKLQKNQTVCKL